LPSGFTARIKRIHAHDQDLAEAFSPLSVAITLDREIDLSRGDMLAKPNNQPTVGQDLDVMLCWFSEKKSLTPGARYLLRHTTKECRALVRDVHYKVDVNTLRKVEGDPTVGLNEIARVTLRASAPVFYDSYRRNRVTGSILLVDEFTHATVAAGMIR
jgi:sulfate adenylyltransferase subunit 1